MVLGLELPYYVKEVRYNGSPVRADIFALDGNAAAHSLEIVVDDKPAAVLGGVTDGHDPVSQPHVVAVPLSEDPNDPLLSITERDGDKSGNFQIHGLPPGEYRVFAIATSDKAKLDAPGVLAKLLGDALKIELAPGVMQNIQLRLLELR
jgi:hypothetical protein